MVLQPQPDEVDPLRGTAGWHLRIAGTGRGQGRRSPCSRSRPASPPTLERPSRAGPRGGDPRPPGVALDAYRPWSRSTPACPPPSTRRWPTWPRCASSTGTHPERAVVAAGAPWFMTLFGRDSLLTAWMTLPFDGSLAGGVLASLAELQGREDDPASEEQPGRILHELRRHGGSGAVLLPQPLLRHGRRHAALRRPRRRGVAVAGDRRGHAARAWRRPSVAPSTGSSARATPTATASSTTGAATPAGSPNQGWKDSWDGITRADGTLPTAPLALVEVQGYVYAALRGAATLAGRGRHRPPTPPTCGGGPRSSRAASTRSSGTVGAGSSWASTPTADPSTRSPRTPGTRCGPASPTRTRPRRYVERLVDAGPLDRLGAPHPGRARWRPTTR